MKEAEFYGLQTIVAHIEHIEAEKKKKPVVKGKGGREEEEEEEARVGIPFSLPPFRPCTPLERAEYNQ